MADVELSSDEYPGFTGVECPEPFITMPPQPKVQKPGQLTPEKVQEYFNQGFTVADGFFTPEKIEPCKQSYSRLIGEIAQKLYDAGKIKNLYEGYNMSDRLIKLEQEWPGAVVMLLKLGQLTPEFAALYQHERLLNAIEQLVGPEIGASPVWNTRPKTPNHAETEVPWHQDSAYFDKDSYRMLIATAWIAFVDITRDNGCMQFVRGGHRKGMVCVHECCDNFYLMIKDEELQNRLGANPDTDFISCPVKAGGIVFFNNMTPHRSLPNRSDHIRFAMDLRYQDANKPWGFYGMSKGILLRSPSHPGHVPDWDFYCNQNRYSEIEKRSGDLSDGLNTFLTGPHMEMWKIVKASRHTEQYFKEKREKEAQK
ncbi:phytanoyl-CoA dioxygenase domain-containing protein 1 homolog [Dreissena polymorpha]|uniref:Phytanoyl-CoA dioxygenase family protein n=1 Tax=Dreissena polymorpha TaxID=45954 RepID=A0A9D4MYI4_DREPO|nr:phytanoyl-CoA dioxygenase domain-containing protein 1 homolog [Dreissena polymorpha]KAH3884094.1 hypothetical protein DPMN_008067 [Dreissena polymorpha]